MQLQKIPSTRRGNAQSKVDCLLFNCILLVTIFSPLLAIGLFNIVIDPYGLMNTPSFIGVNQLKIAQPRHVRLFKAVAITRIKPTKDVIKDALQKNTQIKIQISEQYINDFVTIVHTCNQRNINLKVFISPVHTTEMEEFRTAGLWPVFEDWKRRVSKVTPLWDFSVYNSITTERITNDMKNFTDRGHYTRKIGDLILNRLFHYQEEKVPNDFGILITPTNIESHLEKIRTDQELWAKNNPKMIQIIEELKSQVCSKNSCRENAAR